MYNKDNIWQDEQCKFIIGKDIEGNDIEVDAIKKETGIWIENGTMLVEPSQIFEDSRKPNIGYLRQAKIQELDLACNQEINNGFEWNGRTFGFDQKDDQINIEAIKNNIALGIIQDGTLEYYCKGGECEHFRNSDFLELYKTAMNFKMNRIHTCKAMKAIAKVATEQELEGIQWVKYSIS